MSLFVDSRTVAENAGKIKLSGKLLKRYRPDLFGINRFIMSRANELQAIAEFAQYGDSQPAIVASVEPLLIAVFADEMDAVAMVKLPSELVDEHNLKVGDRILSVNVYNDRAEFDSDLIVGKDYLDRWSGFIPTIVEFISKEEQKIEERKKQISEVYWQRAEVLAKEYLELKPNVYREGFPAYPL